MPPVPAPEKIPFAPITIGAGDHRVPVTYTIRPGLQNVCLLYNRAGAAWFECRGKTWLSRPGDLLLLVPPQGGAIRYGSAAPAFRWSTYWAHFEPRTHWFAWFTWPQVSPGVMALRLGDDANSRKVRAVFARASSTARGLPFDERYHAIEAILLACRRIDPNASPTRDERLQRAVDHIMLRYAEPITLVTLTGVAGVSASQLARLFRRHAGMLPFEYLEAVRMRHATQLLTDTDLPVHEVARRCGFGNAYYFSTRFKRYARTSPRELRRGRVVSGSH